jgi:hypothetical protein
VPGVVVTADWTPTQAPYRVQVENPTRMLVPGVTVGVTGHGEADVAVLPGKCRLVRVYTPTPITPIQVGACPITGGCGPNAYQVNITAGSETLTGNSGTRPTALLLRISGALPSDPNIKTVCAEFIVGSVRSGPVRGAVIAYVARDNFGERVGTMTYAVETELSLPGGWTPGTYSASVTALVSGCGGEPRYVTFDPVNATINVPGGAVKAGPFQWVRDGR